MFGPTTVGFIKADCVAERLNGRPGKIPAIVFIRGDAVAILVKVTVTEQAKSYYVLTNQLRFPVGQYCLEIAAGMMDDRGDFGGVAAKELEEELGIKINEDDLRELGAFYPSPGGCDESIQLYSYETEISESEFNAKQRAIYGASEENERILLQFVPEKKFSSLLYDIGDAKAEVAYRRYLLDKRRDRAASCGYSPKTSRCGIKYAGKNPEYCTYNEDTSRCRIVDLKRKGRKL
jgi:8-oxo-dGTP pyrophosphatase MutT (NUDIX family)